MSATRIVRTKYLRRAGDVLAVAAHDGAAVVTTTLDDPTLAAVLTDLAEAVSTGDYYLDRRT